MSVYLEKKTGRYMYDFQYKKNRYSESGYKTKKEAKEAEAEKKKGLKSLRASPTQIDMGFLELVNMRLDWLQNHRGERHYKDTLYIARRWIKQWKDLAVAEISPLMIETYLGKVKSAISVATANKELRYLRNLFNHGIKPPRRWFTHNPTDGLEFYRIEEIQERYVPPIGDVLKVMLAANSEQQDYLWTIALTMGRKGEIDRLKWKDVDFEQKIVTLHTRKTKGGNLRARRIPMVPKDRKFYKLNEIACPLAHLPRCIKGPIGQLLNL